MINLPSWLFLSSFEILRKNLIKNCQIDSLLHMGRGIFAIDWGSVAFIISKHSPCLNGSFFRLHERNFQHLYYNHIGQLFKKFSIIIALNMTLVHIVMRMFLILQTLILNMQKMA